MSSSGLLHTARFHEQPLTCIPEMSDLFNRDQATRPLTLQQAYLLGYFLRGCLNQPSYTPQQKNLVKRLFSNASLIHQLLNGSHLSFHLSDRTLRFMLDTKDICEVETRTNVLQFMTMWVGDLESVKSKYTSTSDLDIFERLTLLMSRLPSLNELEDRIVFANIIGKDILELMPKWILEVEKRGSLLKEEAGSVD